MSKNVKRAGSIRAKNSTKISTKHQVTIPKGAFRDAGLKPGDTLRVDSDGAGRVVLTRIDELADRYAGSISSGGKLGRTIKDLREEWR